MISRSTGSRTLWIGQDPGVMAAALDLRANVFRSGGCDKDPDDDHAAHLAIQVDQTTVLAARVLQHATTHDARTAYTGQRYQLDFLQDTHLPVLEFGRLCMAPAGRAQDLRLAFAGLTRMVDATGARILLGCVSLPGVHPEDHAAVLAPLWPRFAAPDPGVRPRSKIPHHSRPIAALPQIHGPTHHPLLSAYLDLGAWIGPDLIVDEELNTCHVLTVLQIDRIPPERARVLRLLSAGA